MLPEGNVGGRDGRDDERRKYLKRQCPRYERSDRAGRSQLLSEMEMATGLHRKGLLRLLHAPSLERRPRTQQRRLTYGADVERVVVQVWASLDYICAEWLTPTLLTTARHMARFGVVRRLLRLMGLEAIYPGPRISRAAAGHRIYPYLLRGVPTTQRNQVWSTDITYVRIRQGFCYLVAFIDWFSRYVLAWEVATSLEVGSCLVALDRALLATSNSGLPAVFNTDQGAQFTSGDFTGRLRAREIKISMEGRGRALDNVFVERLWRSVKQEEVYIHDYQTVAEAVNSLGRYFEFYNQRRLHQALEYQTPAAVYWGG
ncbi:MAG: IS3 family transposase [Gemmatimonadaceae bacterium]